MIKASYDRKSTTDSAFEENNLHDNQTLRLIPGKNMATLDVGHSAYQKFLLF